MRYIFLCSIFISFFSPSTFGHHSFGGVYDTETIVELDAQITRVFWQNPHVRFSVTSVDQSGAEVEWDVEANSLSLVLRAGITADLAKPGDNVKISGWPARRKDTSLFVLNMLLPTGDEVLWGGRNTRPLWTENVIGDWSVWLTDGQTQEPLEQPSIFTVWTTNLIGQNRLLWEPDYPLTPSARAAQTTFNPDTDSPIANCAPKGMPYIMEQPYPMQFIDQGEKIVLHLEEYDTLRTIYLDPDSAPNNPLIPRLGTSIGQWEGDVLVVHTTNINWTHFDPTGIPIGPNIKTTERFTLSNNGGRLDYEVEVTDPATFTDTVILTSYWTRRAGVEVNPYECAAG